MIHSWFYEHNVWHALLEREMGRLDELDAETLLEAKR
jgi:hypothetical protein